VDKRFRLWKHIIKDEGYSLKYGEYEDWANVPIAVKDDEEIPLAVCFTDKLKNTCLITIRDIIANKKNFYILRKYHRQEQSYYIPEFDIKVNWKSNKICDLELIPLY